jgi:hypothetical protein
LSRRISGSTPQSKRNIPSTRTVVTTVVATVPKRTLVISMIAQVIASASTASPAIADRGEVLLERDREQEGEEHLHPRQRDPQLLQQLSEVAIEPLVFGLVSSGAVIGHRRNICLAGRS